jgi:predicted MFS family arabinose efflux permease
VSDTPDGPAQGGAQRAARPYLSPFGRLVRTHALMVAGDATVAVALAGSLFFSIDPAQARWRVALYLLFTVAPFAIIAPFLGPAIDRVKGGRRMMVMLVAGGRALVSLLMFSQLDSLLLFPLAFVALVLGRAYQVAKSALVPTVVRHEGELVEANAKLGTVAGVAGFVAAVPAGIMSLIGPELVVLWSTVFFVLAVVSARQLPRAAIALRKATAEETAELHATSIVMAASAMTILRSSAGFLTFLIAFWLRDEGASTAFFGVVLSASAIGTLVGNVVGPKVRQRLREEMMMLAALVLTAIAGIVTAVVVSNLAAAACAGVVGFSAAMARLGFDATLQRDAPDANQGRAFAQFETRFQLGWVLAAFVPVALPIPGWAGFLIVGLIAAVGAIWYVTMLRALRRSGRLPVPVGRRVGRYLHQRRVSRAAPRTMPPPSTPPPTDLPPPLHPEA